MNNPGKKLLLLPIIAIFLMVAACSDKSWQLTDISGHLPGLEFSLTSDNGQPVTQNNYRGNAIILYFGFTGCSAECPLTLAKLKPILAKIPNTHMLFVTIDPGNDTPEILHSYLSAYDAKHITGLTGSQADITALAKRYRIAYRPSNGHSSVMYIFDKQGRARLVATADDADEKIIHDLEIISNE